MSWIAVKLPNTSFQRTRFRASPRNERPQTRIHIDVYKLFIDCWQIERANEHASVVITLNTYSHALPTMQ